MTLRKFFRFFKHFPYYMKKDINYVKQYFANKKEAKRARQAEAVSQKEEQIVKETPEVLEEEVLEKLEGDCYLESLVADSRDFFRRESENSWWLLRRYPSGTKRRVYVELQDDGKTFVATETYRAEALIMKLESNYFQDFCN